MKRLEDTRFERFNELATTMMSSTWFLVFGLLVISALTRPYIGLEHDARMYSVQVANQMRDGMHQEDLFFAFGSQDSYSIFSYVLAPLAEAAGIENAFWLCFMTFTVLLAFAEVQLVRRLVPDKVLALVALVLLAVTDITYGGRGIFRVHESFFTARLVAEALVLMAIVQWLDGRRLLAVVIVSAAMLVHPLMAVSGVALIVGCVVLSLIPGRLALLLSALACAAGAALLHSPTLCRQIFGQFDAEWYLAGYQVSRHCFLTQWELMDWIAIVMALTTVMIAGRHLERRAADMCLLVAILAIASLAVTLIAEHTGFALLIQGQAYRSLWILQTLGVVLAVPVGWRLLHAPSVKSRAAGLAIAVHYLVAAPLALHLAEKTVTNLLLFSVLWILAYGIAQKADGPIRADRHRAEVASVVAFLLLGLFGSVHLWIVFYNSLKSVQVLPITAWYLMTYITCALIWVALGLALLGGIYRQMKGSLRATIAMAVLWLLVAGATYVVQTSEAYCQRFVRDYGNVGFVRGWLDRHDPAKGGPTQVYWPTEVVRIWLNLERNSFYSWAQMQGVFFSRELAIEGRRRSRLARVFEIAYLREWKGGHYDLNHRHNLFLGAGPDEPEPAVEHLLALAADPILDWIVLTLPFEGLYAATNGEVYIYDASKLRRQQTAGHSTTNASVHQSPTPISTL